MVSLPVSRSLPRLRGAGVELVVARLWAKARPGPSDSVRTATASDGARPPDRPEPNLAPMMRKGWHVPAGATRHPAHTAGLRFAAAEGLVKVEDGERCQADPPEGEVPGDEPGLGPPVLHDQLGGVALAHPLDLAEDHPVPAV